MKAKEKYTEIIKEVVRNEAVSKDKLVALAKKHKANKLKIELFLRQAGVIKNMGKGVNRVLIRGQEIEPYVDAVVEMSNTSKKRPKKKVKKAEKLDMSLPEKRHDEDPNTRARTKPYFDDNDTIAYEEAEPYTEIPDDQLEQAEEDIDMRAKMLEMINAHMDKVQTNTNKQNEYISSLAAKIDETQRKVPYQRIVELEKRIGKLESFVDDIDHTELIEDPVTTLRHRIEVMEDKQKALYSSNKDMGNHVVQLDGNIKALQQIFTGHKTEIRNGGALKALHTLIGELI